MPWTTLELVPTRDEREVRRAYARLLKKRDHEHDPDFFAMLREAYEEALRLCRFEDDSQTPALRDSVLSHTASDEQAEQDISPRMDCSSTGHVSSMEEHAQGELAPVQVLSTGTRSEEVMELQAEPKEEQWEERWAEQESQRQLSMALQHLEERLALQQSGNSTEGTEGTEGIEVAEALAAWQVLREHNGLHRLDIREDVAGQVATIIARHWPRSRPIWERALPFFGWMPPTSFDRGYAADALRWLFGVSEIEEGRWQQLREFYANEQPHPDSILARDEAAWKRRVRFIWNGPERLLMKRFVKDVDTLGLAQQLSARADVLAWWLRATNTPALTKRHLALALLGLIGALFSWFDEESWWGALAAGVLAVVWHGLEWGWFYWCRSHGNPIQNHLNLFKRAPPILLAMGVMCSAVSVAAGTDAPAVAGALLCALSAIMGWAWIAPRSHLPGLDGRGLLRFGLWFLVNCALWAYAFGVMVRSDSEWMLPARCAYGAALAFWVVLGAGHTLNEYDRCWPRLAKLPLEVVVAVSSVLLLVAHLMIASTPAGQSLLCGVDTLVVLLCWACVMCRDWPDELNGFVIFAAVVVLPRVLDLKSISASPLFVILLAISLVRALIQVARR